MRKILVAFLGVALTALLTACPRHHIHKHHGPPPHAKAKGHVKHAGPPPHAKAKGHGKVVVIKKGHLHTAHCGHYHYRGKWYHHHGHVHKHGCGHVLRGGLWIIID